MIVRSARSFGRDSPVHAYWLTCCKGFSVRANGRVVGVVEEVVCAEPVSGADALVVRRRGVLHHERVVPAERVEAVVPGERELLLSAPARVRTQREPVVRPLLRALGCGLTRAAVVAVALSHRFAVRAAPLLRSLGRGAAVLATGLGLALARASVRSVRAARARGPVVGRSLARFAAASHRLR